MGAGDLAASERLADTQGSLAELSNGSEGKERSRHRSEAPTRSFSRPELNSLRFLAFFLVFLDHSLPVYDRIDSYRFAGAFGVAVFFILSAYLIVSLLVREHRATKTINLPFFFIRRILRIWPLYVTVLIGGFILGRIHPDVIMPKRMLAAFLVLAGNFYVARNGWTFSPASILWSLSVEEQFYLVIPLIGRFGGVRGLRIACWIVFLLGFPAVLYYGLHRVDDSDIIRLNSLICFQFFALGGLIAFHPQVGVRGRMLRLRSAMVGFGLLIFVLAADMFSHVLDRMSGPLALFEIDLLVIIGSLAVFYGFLYFPAKKRSLFGYLGLISYGLYVFHPWCLELFAELRDAWYHETHAANLVANLLAFALTIVISAVSYKFFERPILRLKQRFEIIHTIRTVADIVGAAPEIPQSLTEPQST